MKKFFLSILVPLIGISTLPNQSQGKEPSTKITAQFKPAKVALGQTTFLNISFSGDAIPSTLPSLPKIEGISILSTNISTSTSITNEQANIEKIFTYVIKPTQAGTFTLKEIQVGNKVLPTTTATLTVLESLGENADNPDQQPHIHMTLETPKKNIYVGEMVPLMIKLLVPEGALLNVLTPHPLKVSDAFDELTFEAPEQITQLINDYNYRIANWKTYIMPYKSGKYELEYKLVIQVDRYNLAMQSSYLNSVITSSVFMPSKPIDLYTKPLGLNILPLPQGGKPKDFTGAIGDFSLQGFALEASKLSVGEPTTLTVKIQGKGNLDHISPPILKNTNNWKVYNPKKNILTKSNQNTSGVIEFKYIIIAQTESIKEAPVVTFNYFDPQKEQYYQLSTPPIKIEVTKSPSTAVREPAPMAYQNGTTNKSADPGQTSPKLLPNKLQIRHKYTSLAPIFIKKWFYIIQLLPATFIVFLFARKYRKIKFTQDKAYILKQESDKKVFQCLHKLRKAYTKKEEQAFYTAAAEAISEITGQVHPSASAVTLTLEEIKDYYKAHGAPQELLTQVEHIFQTANVLKFSGISENSSLTKQTLSQTEALIEDLQTWTLNRFS